MSPVSTPAQAPLQRRTRTLLVGFGLAMLFGSLAFLALMPGKSQTRDDQADMVVIASWAVIAGTYAWMRFRPRKPYPDTARPRAEAFQAKRAWLLIVCAVYLALAVTPMVVWEALRLDAAHKTLVDRLFYATLFIGPAGLVLGLVTTGIYSRQWSALVDDELSLANRFSAFRAGFWAFAGLGAVALVVSLLRPDLAVAAIPAVAGPAIAATGLRFALLERAAAASND